MQLIHHLVKCVQALTDGCGYEKNSIILSTEKEQSDRCPYEIGTAMNISFGGKNTYFTSTHPQDATTKPEYMFSAALTKPAHRASAAAIIAGMSGFLCFSRILGACAKECHQECIESIKKQIGVKKVYCLGEMKQIRDLISDQIVSDPSDAELILLSIDGLNEDTTYNVESKTPMLCIGPSIGGIASLFECEHACPCGRTTKQQTEL
ncbi:MAG: hypothetical protein LBV40_07900 [Methanomicrobiales archaeon]|jgi:fructose-specific component phosphotransferase system IIB-like protein|nr:hypothetical protein [Methanomicrobiales archaeon]